MKCSIIFLVLLFGVFQLAGVEKILEVKETLVLTAGVKKEIPCDPKFNFGPEQSFTVELEYFQSSPNPAPSHSSSLVKHGFWSINAANRSGTPIFVAAGRENKRWEKFYAVVALQKKSFGKWHHAAFVRDAKQKILRFYHNGKLLRELPDANAEIFSAGTLPLIIGGTFEGRIRGLILWNDAKDRFDHREQPRIIPRSVAVDPELQNSWDLLRGHKLNIVPAPKKMRLTGKPFLFRPGEWSVKFTDRSSAPGYAVFCKRAGKTGNGKNYIEEKYDHSLKPQGYRIRFFTTGATRRILLEGADPDGMRYAWLTLAYLIDERKMMHPAAISDYPSFRGRMTFALTPQGKAERLFPVIEDAFQHKTNSMGINILTEFEKWRKWPISEWKKINSYAAERGIRFYPVLSPKVLDLGDDFRKLIPPGYSHYFYPYKPEDGLFGYKSGAFSWCRDDLAQKRAEQIAEFCAETGLGGVTIHSIDHGGFDNPGNWGKRTPMDREKWGDDYASAHAHLMNIFIREIHKKSPDLQVYLVPYPYVATDHGKTLRFYRGFSKKLIRKNTMLPMREAERELFVSTCKAYGDAVVNAAYYPFLHDFYPSYMNAGRFAATFFMDEKHHIAVYMSSLLGKHENPCKTVTAEYLWNPFAPGAACMPENKYDYSVVYETVPLIENELLPRAAARIVGEKAAPAFVRIYAFKFTDKIPEIPHNLLPAGTDHKQYFEALLSKIRAAREIYDGAKDQVVPSGANASKLLDDFLTRMDLLTQARLHCIYAREALNKGDAAAAEKEALAGKNILKNPRAHVRNLHKKIEADLNIADRIQLSLLKNKYLKTVPFRKIRVGFYKYSGTASIKDVIGTLPETLDGAAGITVSLISNLTRQNLKSFDVIIFNATKDIGDCDEPWRDNLIDFVKNGGGIIFSHNAVGRFDGGLKTPLFPEICTGFKGRAEEAEMLFSDGSKSRHRYLDHCQIRVGPAGKIICRDRFQKPVTVIGIQGKGRVVYTGEIFGMNRKDNLVEPEWDEWLRLFKLIRWVSGGE